VAGNLFDPLKANPHSELVEFLNYFSSSADPRPAQLSQHFLDYGFGWVDEITEHVHFALLDVGTQLDPGPHLESSTGRVNHRRDNAVGRVVIGDGQQSQPFFKREINQSGRGEPAIGGGGVRVEVNPAGHLLAPCSSSRKAPTSLPSVVDRSGLSQ